jgi:tocopherol O-methyltransferase
MSLVTTDRPLVHNQKKITKEIGEFWNHATEAFQTIWGPHIHHGYFETHTESPLEAQEKLIEKLLELLKADPQGEVLDVGSGMGGSSYFLTKRFPVHVTGITLSQKQVEMASAIKMRNQKGRAEFKIEDAQSLTSVSDNSVDLVWSLESCEQFFDKQKFISQAFRVLKPGGKIILATWCSSAEAFEGKLAADYIKLCKSLQLPYMPTIEHYETLLKSEKFIVDESQDWSSHVQKSWSIGLSNMRKYSLYQIFKMSGWRGLMFIKPARLMQKSFLRGQLRYGVFLAHKPKTATSELDIPRKTSALRKRKLGVGSGRLQTSPYPPNLTTELAAFRFQEGREMR